MSPSLGEADAGSKKSAGNISTVKPTAKLTPNRDQNLDAKGAARHSAMDKQAQRSNMGSSSELYAPGHSSSMQEGDETDP
jgi:hypothetical protein